MKGQAALPGLSRFCLAFSASWSRPGGSTQQRSRETTQGKAARPPPWVASARRTTRRSSDSKRRRDAASQNWCARPCTIYSTATRTNVDCQQLARAGLTRPFLITFNRR